MTRPTAVPTKAIMGLAASLVLSVSAADAQEVRWWSDYNAARHEAKDKNLPLVIDFGTVNCTWCRKLDATTFRDPAVVKLLSERFIALRIDAAKDAPLAQMLGITSYPTLVFAAPDGKILGKNAGYVEVQRFTQQLERAFRESGAAVTQPSNSGATRPNSVRITFPVPDVNRQQESPASAELLAGSRVRPAP
jgi:thioredoxin-related protein